MDQARLIFSSRIRDMISSETRQQFSSLLPQ
jgi:hypothetical protein